ncbi:hypothetical protein Tco_1090801 [Tanacetum coccineum]|uniref:Retrovirus-related Pol polyprotein from transposon TNT 1-94 n=1 Tax=Tanacetum coccineum TaxID=301880 RepID=A0ABQ5I594_9ASTR
MFSAEAEYVSLSACCAQVLWLRTQLTNYGFHFDKIPMYCDSKATIAISCNPVQHSRTKHINVKYHFIKEQVEKGIVELFFVGTEYPLTDLFTKALSKDSRWIEVATKGLISSLGLNWRVRWCQLECGPRGGFVVCEGCQWSGGHNGEDGGIVLFVIGG